MPETAPSDVERLIEQGLDTYDIAVDGDITVTSVADNEYEAEVPFTCELIIDEAFANQGSLLYIKDPGELTLKGVRDGQLLLTVRLHE